MRINYKNKLFDIQLRKRIVPISITEVVREFNNEPETPFRLKSSKLEGQVALVTGAYKGIGLAIASLLLRNGVKVIITGRNEDILKSVALSFNDENITYMKWDISDIMGGAKLFNIAEQRFGAITILVNNAGVTTKGNRRLSFEEMDDDHIHYVHGINTLGTRSMCVNFAERYNRGVVLNILSNTSILPAKDAYFTSKWAIRAFTECFGKECIEKGKNIVVCGLCPGPVKTDMSFDQYTSLHRTMIPNHRIALPEEVAELAYNQIYLAIKFGFGNGKITVCDGGESLMI